MRIILLLILASCAGRPAFQRFNGTTGFSIEKGTSNSHFKVKVMLPENTDQAYRREYAWIAAGLECQDRGYAYFETADESPNSFHGLCHQDSQPRSLMLLFRKKGLSSTPPRFIVEKISPKPTSHIQPNDEVLSVDGVKTTSMMQLKLQVKAVPMKKTTMAVKLKRKGKTITVKEPIGLFPHQLFAVTEVASFRKQLK